MWVWYQVPSQSAMVISALMKYWSIHYLKPQSSQLVSSVVFHHPGVSGKLKYPNLTYIFCNVCLQVSQFVVKVNFFVISNFLFYVNHIFLWNDLLIWTYWYFYLHVLKEVQCSVPTHVSIECAWYIRYSYCLFMGKWIHRLKLMDISYNKTCLSNDIIAAE